MPTADTQVTIIEGLPPSDPWVISELDTNLKNLALARLAALGASQGKILRTQTAVLNEQVKQLESMSANAGKLASDLETSPVLDASGKVLISDPAVVSDLVGRSPSSLTASEVDRLIQFTSNLSNSSPPVNLGGRTYVSVVVGEPPTEKTIQAPLEVYPLGLNLLNTDFIQPFTCYASDRDSNGVVLYRMFDQDKREIDISSVSSLADTTDKFVFDAYRLNGLTYIPHDYIGSPPARADVVTLYRNVVTGDLTLASPSGSQSISNAVGFVVPASQNEIYYWLGQACGERLIALYEKLKADGITPPDPDVVQWKYHDGAITGGGVVSYPPAVISKFDAGIPDGSVIQDIDDKKYYLITRRVGIGDGKSVVEVDLLDAFALKLSKEVIVKMRGQYTEKIANATQRTTEQQLFLNSLLQKQNYHFDAATNVLKAFGDLVNRLAGLV